MYFFIIMVDNFKICVVYTFYIGLFFIMTLVEYFFS
jgi:hypothetical protein